MQRFLPKFFRSRSGSFKGQGPRTPSRRTRLWWLIVCVLFLTILLSSIGITFAFLKGPYRLHAQTSGNEANALGGPLPGQSIWRNGVSSYLFGTNDPTFDHVMPTDPNYDLNQVQSMRSALKQAGITLIRTPLAHNGGQEIEQRLAQIQQIGAACLGILSTTDLALDLKVVDTAGTRCQMYEFGNEPDNSSSNDAMSPGQYASQWNAIIPALRQDLQQKKIQAMFIGPVVASPNTGYIRTFLQNVPNALPDAVSFHMYPCTNVDQQTCLTQNVNEYAPSAQRVRATVRQVLNRDLPLGVTEWNDNWRNQAKPEESDPAFMTAFTTKSLQSLAQGQIAFANQYNMGTGANDGHLLMTANGQAKPQLQAMATMIAQLRITARNPTPPTPVPSPTAALTAGMVVPTHTSPTFTGTIQDTFQRPDQPSWTTTTVPWSADATNGTVFSIQGNAGQIAHDQGQSNYTALLDPSTTNVDLTLTGSVNQFNVSQVNLGVVTHWTDSNNFYKLDIDGQTLLLQKYINGVLTKLDAVPFPAQNGVSYTLRLHVEGTNLSGMAWSTGKTAPNNWMVKATDNALPSGISGLSVMLQPDTAGQPGTSISITSFSETFTAVRLM